MRQVLTTTITFFILLLGVGENPVQEIINAQEKAGCKDPYALNYCHTCTISGGVCFYDTEFKKSCEDPSIHWKSKYNPLNEHKYSYTIVTFEDCWEYWDVNIYDSLGATIWFSDVPNDDWYGKDFRGNYLPTGVYFMTIKGETRGNTKQVDILTEIEIYYDEF